MADPVRGLHWLPQVRYHIAGRDTEETSASSVASLSTESLPAEPARVSRREPRLSAGLTVAVCGLASDGHFFVELSPIVNVSRSGCCVRLRRRPQADAALALRGVPGGASLPESVPQVLLQIAWLRPQNGGWLAGASALGRSDLRSLAFPSVTP